MNLDPAWGTCNVLSVVLRAPALDETHADGAHFGELVDGLEALVDRLRQELGKLLVVEDLQAAAGRYFADGGRVEPVGVVTLPTLDKDGSVAETLGENFATDVKEVHPFPDVTPNVLNGGVPVDVGEQAEAESICRRRRVGVAVDHNVRASGVEGFSDPLVELVVGDGAPVARLLVLHLDCGDVRRRDREWGHCG